MDTRSVQALSVTLHERPVAVLIRYAGTRNRLVLAPGFIGYPPAMRETFTLAQVIDEKFFGRPRNHQLKLDPVLSNVLPEGALRDLMTKRLKIHADDEFALIAATGENLPGAVKAVPLAQDDIPEWALAGLKKEAEAVPFVPADKPFRFSLAGVQMKLSGSLADGRFAIGVSGTHDEWIIKTPSQRYPFLPENEYSAMCLAGAAGIRIPEIRLVPVSSVSGLTAFGFKRSQHAFALRRFDRRKAKAVHAEDFAQIFGVYPDKKYAVSNYEQIGRVLYRYSMNPLADVKETAKRLLVNILLGNGDAHIKNWSVVYPDRKTPCLSPAYDIVSTVAYVPGETDTALNMARSRNWYTCTPEHFAVWAERVGVPWPAIRISLRGVMERARELWPKMLTELPMDDAHKAVLREHWQKLPTDFRISV